MRFLYINRLVCEIEFYEHNASVYIHVFPSERQSTVGIQCDRWVYKKAGATTQITFYTWDFAGQVTHTHTHK